MSTTGGKAATHAGGMRGPKKTTNLLELYDEFRNFVRKVSQEPVSRSDFMGPEMVSAAKAMKVELDDYIDAYVACKKVKNILNHPFLKESIKVGKSLQAELGTDERKVVENDIRLGLEVFFISTGEKLLVKKRGHFGLVYYFGWYETKPLIMRNIDLIEFGKTGEGYQLVNADFDQTKQAILEYLELQ